MTLFNQDRRLLTVTRMRMFNNDNNAKLYKDLIFRKIGAPMPVTNRSPSNNPDIKTPLGAKNHH